VRHPPSLAIAGSARIELPPRRGDPALIGPEALRRPDHAFVAHSAPSPRPFRTRFPGTQSIPFTQELRAMDRRRFVPATEGLEQRALLTTSTPNLANIFGFQVSTNLNIPITFEQKELRVEHLPFYMEKILPGRFLPRPELKQIQADLFQFIAKLNKPNPATLDQYNRGLRPLVSKQSLTATDAAILNKNFGTVLTAASASPSVVASLQSTVFKLVTQVDTASPQPVVLATNDYSLILQTALAIGRPMPSPILPKIAKDQGIQANSDHIKTTLKHPTLVGTYHFHTHIQVVTTSGVVVGTTAVRPNNRYKVVIETPLSPGVYQFRIRAYDDGGNLSRPSRLFAIKVEPKR
jgi:hypothetical protein